MGAIRSDLSRGFRRNLREVVRLYTMHAPVQKGKDRLRLVLDPLIRPEGKTIVTQVPYGQTLEVFVGEYVSDQIYYYGCFERPLVDLIAFALRPGMTFFDVGGHVGLYTTVAAHAVGPAGHVFAFEPADEMFQLLEANVRRNGHANVACVKSALSDKTGSATLYLAGDSIRAGSTMGRPQWDNRAVEIATVTMDDFLASPAGGGHPPSVVKMDIEGAELLALKGAEGLLQSKHKPSLIQLELDERLTRRFGHGTRDVMNLIMSYGYHLYKLHDGRLVALDRNAEQLAVDGLALLPGHEMTARLLARYPTFRNDRSAPMTKTAAVEPKNMK